jgi:hypothetical protein
MQRILNFYARKTKSHDVVTPTADYDSLKRNLRLVFNDMLACCLLGEICNAGSRKKLGPNAKPVVHYCVANLYDLWKEFRPDGSGQKKELIEFIYLCLEPARANITRETIRESLDRHVLPARRGLSSRGN